MYYICLKVCYFGIEKKKRYKRLDKVGDGLKIVGLELFEGSCGKEIQ